MYRKLNPNVLMIESGVCAKRSLTSPRAAGCGSGAGEKTQTHSSCPDLIRASINLRDKLFSKKMDHRVKPGDDDLNWYDDLVWSSALARISEREMLRTPA